MDRREKKRQTLKIQQQQLRVILWLLIWGVCGVMNLKIKKTVDNSFFFCFLSHIYVDYVRNFCAGFYLINNFEKTT